MSLAHQEALLNHGISFVVKREQRGNVGGAPWRGKAGGFGVPVTGLHRFPPLPCALVGWGELGV